MKVYFADTTWVWPREQEIVKRWDYYRLHSFFYLARGGMTLKDVIDRMRGIKKP